MKISRPLPRVVLYRSVVESDLAMHQPASALRPFVASAHGYRAPANPFGLHRGLPSRHLTLVIELEAPLRLTGLGSEVVAHGVVGGLHTAPVLIDASMAQQGLQYGLTPAGSQALLGVPAAALHDAAVDLGELLGSPTADELVGRLRGAQSWSERFGLLDAALLHLLAGRAPERSPAPPEVRRAWELVFASEGGMHVAEVARRVGWSRQHLTRRFRQHTGLGPKEAARIARFEAAREMLTTGPGAAERGLAQIAYACGYADQPHFSREWRALAGCSPSTWLREELPFLQDGGQAHGAGSTA